MIQTTPARTRDQAFLHFLSIPQSSSLDGSVPAILDRAGPGARFAADEFFRAWCEAQDVELARHGS